MNWSHKSLELRNDYSVTHTRVLLGCTIVAWLKKRRNGQYAVYNMQGVVIGDADTPAQAMLMTARHRESPRCGS